MLRIQKPFLKLIAGQLVEFKFYYLAAVVCILFTNYFQSELPFYAKELGDLVVANKMQDVPYHVYILVALGIVIFRTTSRVLFFYPARILQGHLMGELIDLLENTSSYRLKDYTSGQLYQTLQVDIQNIRGLIGFAFLQITNVIIAISILLPKIASFNSDLLIAFSPMLVAVVMFALIIANTQKYFRKIQDYQGDVQNFIIESYEGKKTIKNFHAEKSFFQLFEDNCQRELKMFFKATFGPATSIPLIKLGVGLSFIWGATIILKNDLGATSMILFSGFVFLLLSPLLFISWIGGIASRTWGSWQRIKELLITINTRSEIEENIFELNQENELSEMKVLLWNKVLKIDLGDSNFIALVGETGVGKSYILEQISIALIRNGEKANMVFQEPYLFNDSLFANIFMGKDPSDLEKEKARELLILFGLDILKEEGEDLFDLEIGENGKRVSGGQGKRIALIRSLMSDGKFLIWDDPFSSVDLILEEEIFSSLKEKDYFKDRKLLFSSHRLSSVRQSNECLLIKKDSSSFSGKIPEVLGKGNPISEFFENQLV